MTSDLDKRLLRHNRGHEKTTKPYAPFKLIFTEDCSNRELTRSREKYWKSGTGKEKLKLMK